MIDWPAIFGVQRDAAARGAATRRSSIRVYSQESSWSSDAWRSVVVSSAPARWVSPPPITRCKRGHEVTVFEAAPRAGGMAAHFDFGGLSIERFYHFVCKADQPTFELMDELGIGDKMRWRADLDGLLRRRRAASLGRSVSLLRSRARPDREAALRRCMMFLSTQRDGWRAWRTFGQGLDHALVRRRRSTSGCGGRCSS